MLIIVSIIRFSVSRICRADPTRSDRGEYRLQFYTCLRQRAAMLSAAGAKVLVLGDINCSHTLLDHCDPDEVGCFTSNRDR